MRDVNLEPKGRGKGKSDGYKGKGTCKGKGKSASHITARSAPSVQPGSSYRDVSMGVGPTRTVANEINGLRSSLLDDQAAEANMVLDDLKDSVSASMAEFRNEISLAGASVVTTDQLEEVVSRTKQSMQDVARGAESATAAQMQQQRQDFTCKIDELKAQHFAAMQQVQFVQDAKLEAVWQAAHAAGQRCRRTAQLERRYAGHQRVEGDVGTLKAGLELVAAQLLQPTSDTGLRRDIDPKLADLQTAQARAAAEQEQRLLLAIQSSSSASGSSGHSDFAALSGTVSAQVSSIQDQMVQAAQDARQQQIQHIQAIDVCLKAAEACTN